MEQNNQLAKISDLENSLAIELSKIDKINPLRPVEESKVQMIDAPKQHKEIIIAAHNYPRVHQYPKLAVRFKLLIAINKTIMFVGYNVQDLDFLYRGVYNYIMEHAEHLTIEEIEIAFSKGVMDEYGEWHGLSAMTFCKWIKSYVNSSKMDAMNSKSKIAKLEREEADKKTPEEMIESKLNWLEFVLNKYDDYLKDSQEYMSYEDYNNSLYNLLYHLNQISFNEEQRNHFKAMAKILLRRSSKRKVDPVLVLIKGKQLAVREWLKQAKIDKVDLRELMNKNKAEEFLTKNI